ncbi:MAG: hypothetical protein R6U04_05475 [Bacteroidales bacterium]
MAPTIIILSLFFITVFIVISIQKSLKKDNYNNLIKKNDFKGFLKLTKLYLREKKWDKAIDTINRWLKQDPYHLRGLSTKAFVYYFMGNFNEASEIIEKGLKIDPNYSEFLYLASELEREKGNKESGKELKEKAYEKNKNLKIIDTWYAGYGSKIDRYVSLYK